jgi:hypothetical protein
MVVNPTMISVNLVIEAVYGFAPAHRSKSSDKVSLVVLEGEYERQPANAMHRHAGRYGGNIGRAESRIYAVPPTKN